MGVQPLRNLVIGVLMGAVSFLPGASGSTIAVIFRVYERLIADVADIRNKLIHDLKFLIPLGIGVLAGMILCAKGLKFLLDEYEVPMMFLFVALILTQIPDIKKMGDDGNKPTRGNIIAFAAGFAVMVVVMIFVIINGDTKNDDPGFFIMLLVGVIMAVSMIAPGISGSTVLVAIGLFYAYDTAIGGLADGQVNMDLLLPLAIGLLVGALLFAKVINYCMINMKKSTYMAILGLNVGSAFTIFIIACRGVTDLDMVPLCILCAFIGAVFGLGLYVLSHKFAESSEAE